MEDKILEVKDTRPIPCDIIYPANIINGLTFMRFCGCPGMI